MIPDEAAECLACGEAIPYVAFDPPDGRFTIDERATAESIAHIWDCEALEEA